MLRQGPTSSGLGTDWWKPAESRRVTRYQWITSKPRTSCNWNPAWWKRLLLSSKPTAPGPGNSPLPGRRDGYSVVSAQASPPPPQLHHPQSQCKTRLEQQLIFQEGLFLKLLQNRPTHQGLHTVLSGDGQWETWPSCCLKTEAFCFIWQETGCSEHSAATATRGSVILY